ncbi:aldo/keto reductase [Bacteriovoracaceae bacterium]|nr:aldo/keto reductase [Bacteriovoracaceae bacterium]
MLKLNEISPIGLGAIVLEKDNTVWVEPNEFIQMLDIATQEYGINYLDSATRYGDCEKYIGKWLKESSIARESILIGSKISSEELTGEAVIEGVDKSLQQVGTDYFDIYWVHSWDGKTPYENTISGFDRSINEGKIRSYGVCHVSVSDLQKIFLTCEENNFPKPSFVQNLFSLATLSQESLDTIKFCQENDIVFTAASPLAGGILTGKYSFNQDLPVDSRWKHWAKSGGLPKYWTKELFDSIDCFKNEVENKNTSMTSLAISWVSNYPGVNCTLVGPRNLKQLQSVQDSYSIELEKRDIDKYFSIFKN